MKKRTVLGLILFLVLVFVIFASLLPKRSSVSNGVSYSDMDGVCVEIQCMRAYPRKTTIEVVWRNNSKHAITYGNAYYIERMQNGKWIDCSTSDNAFSLTGYILKSGENIKKQYLISGMYDISKKGTYRFRSDCYVEDGAGRKASVWAQFVVD